MKQLEVSYEELYNSLLMSDQICIKVSSEDVQKIKNNLKIHKSRAVKKLQDDGMLTDERVLSFDESTRSEDGLVDLFISLKRRPGVRIVGDIIPVSFSSLSELSAEESSPQQHEGDSE